MLLISKTVTQIGQRKAAWFKSDICECSASYIATLLMNKEYFLRAKVRCGHISKIFNSVDMHEAQLT